jgi:DNA-binding NtrC family response regulator
MQRMKILVVDDDAIVIKSCTRILQAEGFSVATVSGAVDALEILRNSEFDLLLVDVKMPVYDGMYLMQEIRRDHPALPIIGMSGYPTQETVTDALRSGATQFIPKPFRPDELMRIIRQVMRPPSGAGSE